MRRSASPAGVPSAVIAAAMAFAALPALAQDEGDHFEKMIEAVETRRDRSLQQVMSAPGKMDELLRHTDLDIGDGQRPPAALPPPTSPFDDKTADDVWMLLVAGGTVLAGSAFFYVTLKRSQSV